MSIKTKKMALATTAALMIAGCASDKGAEAMNTMDDKMGQCHGVNSCKGTSACATAESSCMGHNSCKGQGWIKATKSQCEASGGTFMMKK